MRTIPSFEQDMFIWQELLAYRVRVMDLTSVSGFTI